MVRPHRATRPLIVLAVFLVSVLVPMTSGQATEFCDNPDNPSDTVFTGGGTRRAYDDFSVDMTPPKVRSGANVETLDEVGVHWLGNATGTLIFEVEVTNHGDGTGAAPDDPQLKVRVSISQPGGDGIVQDLLMDPPSRGGGIGNQTVQVDLTQAGRHTIQLRVNPDKVVPEVCDDGSTNNPECPNQNGLPSPCHIEYYDNNAKAYGLILGAQPDLVVSQITASGPARATGAAHTDSEVTIQATVQNLGTVTAYNLDAVTPGSQPLKATIDIDDCTCSPVTVNLDAVSPGATKTVSATLKAHGLASSFDAIVTVDTTDKTIESDEDNNDLTRTLPIPTPDLVVTTISDLPSDNGTSIVQKGRDFVFSVNVQNLGDAPASTTDGSGFKLVVYRDSDTNKVLERTLTLEAHASVSFNVHDTASNLTGDHTYRAVIDLDDDVLEASEQNNEDVLGVTVAVYQLELDLSEANAKPTVPPGVAGRVPFTITNAGTVGDTYRLSVPDAFAAKTSFVDADGQSVREFHLAKGAKFRGELLFDIPRDADKGATFSPTLEIRSIATADTTTRNITFTVGDDTLPPVIELVDPDDGFLSTERVTIRVTDNVNVTLVETDVAVSYQSIDPDEPGGSLYTIDVTGRPATFKLNVRATDSAGLETIEGFDLVRDNTPPRITQATFNPNQGIVPGSRVTLIVAAEDDNMDKVTVSIQQPRPTGPYVENHTLIQRPANFQLVDWIVPERPGHYTFNITAHDKAGNTVTRQERLVVSGLDLRIVPGTGATAVPREPAAGDQVRITWTIENTDPLHRTGPFFVVLVLDDGRQIGIHSSVDLEPGERRPITFVWFATEGFHLFTMVVDQAQEVAEDNEENNLIQTTTDVLFPGQTLFSDASEETASDVVGKMLTYWFVPVLFVATAVLFVIALALGRRTPV